MRTTFLMLLVAIGLINLGCLDFNRDAEELEVNFSWGDMEPCGMGIPEIAVTGVPENTKYFVVKMYDHEYYYSHGKVKVIYNGSNIITQTALKKIEKPCPPGVPGRYKITVKALDENQAVIGIGSKERYFPEEK